MEKSETGRQTISQRVVRRRSLLSIALLVALSVVASPTAKGQVECLGVCEEEFASCLRNSQGQSPEGGCQATYEACVDACLGTSAALLG